MTKEELVEKGAHYFDNKDVDLMYATTDGHWFHSHAKRAAMNHIGGKDLDVIDITREDVTGKAPKVETPEVKEVKEVKEVVIESSETSSEDKQNAKPKTKPKTRSKDDK